MPTSSSRRRPFGIIAAILSALALILPIVLPSLTLDGLRANAEAARVGVGTLYVTSGLSWADVSLDTTPTIACFAEKTGVAAMATTSESVLPTKRQGIDTLSTGERSAVGSPRGSTVPNSISAGGQSIRLVDLGDVNLTGTEHDKLHSLAEIDRAFAEAAGECGGAGSTERVALASVGQINPPAGDVTEVESQRSYTQLATPLAMQVYADSGWGPALLTSPSTRQAGVIMNIDLAPTLAGADGVGIGRAIVGTSVSPGENVEYVHDISVTSRVTEDSLGVVMGAIAATLAAIGVLAWRGPSVGIRRTAADALGVGILAIPLGLSSSVLPLGRLVGLGIPAPLALFSYTVLLTLIAGGLLAIGLRSLAPEGSRPGLLIVGISGLATAGLICLDSILGSYAQFTSLMGNQPLYAGRFYGITNHLTGIMLGAWILGCGALIHALPVFFGEASRRAGLWRALLVGVTGVAIGVVAIAPGMGADAGSALMYLPAALVGALLVSGLRVRPWYLAAALAAGAGVFFGAGWLDYLRPPESRTHLGEFFARIADAGSASGSGGAIGAFWDVFADRTGRMAEPLWLYPVWIVAPAVVAVLGVTVMALLPRGRFFQAFPHAHRLRAAGIGVAWIGLATNDTGLVLLGAAYAAGALMSAAMLCADGPTR